MKLGCAITNPSKNLSQTAKFVRHKETHALTLPYLLKFSLSSPFSAFSVQISYVWVPFQGKSMEVSGFLSDLPIFLRQQLLPTVQQCFLLFLYLPNHLFTTFLFVYYFFLLRNSYLCFLELLLLCFWETKKVYSSGAHQTIQKLEPLPLRVLLDILYSWDSLTAVEDSEPPLQYSKIFFMCFENV